jgi:plasmid maintenance system antidote protein VapI
MSTRGERLVEAMTIRGMHKQYALAYSLGVNESTITRWKNNGPMSLERAIALCRTLDMSLDWFLAGAGSIDQHRARRDDDEQLWSSVRKVEARMSAESKALLIAFIESILPREARG